MPWLCQSLVVIHHATDDTVRYLYRWLVFVVVRRRTVLDRLVKIEDESKVAKEARKKREKQTGRRASSVWERHSWRSLVVL
jgi:hypothetical protein